VIKKPRERGGHSPRWAAEPQKIYIQYKNNFMGSHNIEVFVLYAPVFLRFCKHRPNNGRLRPKLVANNRITIKKYIVMSDGVHI
jgi:hypothetical protein